MSYIIDMTNTEHTDNILEKMISDQAVLVLTDEAKKTYNDTLKEINAILANAPTNIIIKDKFGVAARDSKGPDMMLCSINKDFIFVAMNQFKFTLNRAAKASGTDIVFQYSLRVVENVKGEQIVALLYSYYYMPDMINCANCGQSVERTRDWAKFCSDKCRVAAHRTKQN